MQSEVARAFRPSLIIVSKKKKKENVSSAWSSYQDRPFGNNSQVIEEPRAKIGSRAQRARRKNSLAHEEFYKLCSAASLRIRALVTFSEKVVRANVIRARARYRSRSLLRIYIYDAGGKLIKKKKRNYERCECLVRAIKRVDECITYTGRIVNPSLRLSKKVER